jgi:hypothetical protein
MPEAEVRRAKSYSEFLYFSKYNYGDYSAKNNFYYS